MELFQVIFLSEVSRWKNLVVMRNLTLHAITQLTYLTHFMPLVSFYTPWKHLVLQKETSGFKLIFSLRPGSGRQGLSPEG